jgi:hypothetical protein
MPFRIEDAIAVMKPQLTFPPAVIGWNRLEGRPRTEQFDRALRAEVRDALWFLTRQWQFGEFQGEDAGSPIDVRTTVRVDPLQHYAVRGQGAIAYDPSLSLETHVEREPVAFDLPMHAQASRYFWQLIKAVANLAAVRATYLATYPLAAGAVSGVADDDTWHALQLAGSRVLDASVLLAEVTSGAHDTRVDGFPGLSAADRARLKQAGRDLRTWFLAQFSQPASGGDDAWNPRFLEYQFAVATESADRGQTVLVADQYPGGHLDWFAFDIDATTGTHLARKDGTAATPTPPSVTPLSFIPTPVSFGGMPSHRYWEMENRQVEFADVDAHTTDLAKLLLTEFALVYGNDWCVIPYELPIGALSEVTGMLMSDDFGEQALLLPAGRGFDDQWQRWSMFTMSRSPSTGQADTRFLLPPAVAKLIEAPPVEKVVFLRDEMANMVWAVERVIPSAMGSGIDGYAVAAQAAGLVPPPPPVAPTTASVRYVLGDDVPYNWIPFIPVHVPGSNRSVELQRARLPGTGRAPHGRILSPPAPYYINEEEAPRAGKVITRGYQRVRALNGATLLWMGRNVMTGRGEGSSGLAFDQTVEVPT